jgi:hypothetical protein
MLRSARQCRSHFLHDRREVEGAWARRQQLDLFESAVRISLLLPVLMASDACCTTAHQQQLPEQQAVVDPCTELAAT